MYGFFPPRRQSDRSRSRSLAGGTRGGRPDEIFLYHQVFMLVFKSMSKEPVRPPIALLPGIHLGDRSPGSRMNSESGY